MKDIVILLLFLGISSFIKKMMKNAKEQRQNPGAPAGAPPKGKLMDSISELLGVEEPDRPEAGSSPPAPRTTVPEPVTATVDALPDTYDMPVPGSNGYGIPEPAERHKNRRSGASSRMLRHGILLREVLGPCRAMHPYGTPD